MSGQRNISVEIPEFLLEQIEGRTLISQRKRNAEIRYLLNFILGELQGNDFSIQFQGKVRKTTIRLDYSPLQTILDRCYSFERPLGGEIVRLLAFALQTIADRDREVQQDMVRRQATAAA